MPEVDVNGVRLHYEERGAGEAILCIHGMGSSALIWEDAVRTLADLGRVIAYDRRGCSRSERPVPYERTSVIEQANDAAALLAALDAGPAITIGRSYGGAVALELARRDRDRVRALVLLEADALGLSPEGLRWTRDLADHLRSVAARDGTTAVYEALVDRILGSGAWASFPAEVRAVLSGNGEAVLAELHYVDEPMPGPPTVATIDLPVLLVAATDSPREQRAMTAALAESLPNARLVEVEGGHLIDPAAPAVLGFLSEVLGRSTGRDGSTAPEPGA